MSVKPPMSVFPIAYVRTQHADGTEHRDGLVQCTRRGGSVGLATCAHCPRFVRVEAGAATDSVHCAAGAEPSRDVAAQTPMALPRLPISALMTRNVVCVRPDLTLDAAALLFVESGLKSAPVVDQEGKLVGFISEAEVMLEVQAGSSSASEPQKAVGDVMLPYALALPESASVTRAAAVMAFEGQQRIAVVSDHGSVVGVLSASDILYWLARVDGHVLPRPRLR